MERPQYITDHHRDLVYIAWELIQNYRDSVHGVAICGFPTRLDHK
jgi:hypothetical protein